MSDPNNALLSGLYREYMRADPHMHKPYSKWLEERVEAAEREASELRERVAELTEALRDVCIRSGRVLEAYVRWKKDGDADAADTLSEWTNAIDRARAALSTGEDTDEQNG